MKKLEAHPLAEMLPMMSEPEYIALRDSIRDHKQSDPIELFEGKILDGRNRYRACLELGIEPKLKEFAGKDPIQHVYARAVHRNMSDSQKAAAAVNFLPHFERINAAKKAKSVEFLGDGGTSSTGKSRDLAGSLFGVSGRYVADARTLFENDKKLFKEVFEGRLPLTRAKRLVIRKARTVQAKAAVKNGGEADLNNCSIITGDCLAEMEKLGRAQFRLIFADPPYNLGFKYDSDPTRDQLPESKYHELTLRWIEQCAELLTPDGTLCWMIPEEHVAWTFTCLRQQKLHIRRLIVWHESFGQAGQNNFGRTCRYIWYATKHPTNFVFDPSQILVESKRAAVYGDKRAMPGGKVPDALWDFSRVAGTFAERIPDEGIPTQLPVELVKRAVLCFTEPDDKVLDPFGGTGTTARAAISTGRRCVTIERSRKYAAIIRRELLRMNGEKKGA